MLNEILLRRKCKVLVVPVSNTDHSTKNQAHLITIIKNVENLGFTFSEKLYQALSLMYVSELNEFYLDIVPKLKALIGADVEYKPMYPNFPESVMEADYLELYLNAIMHYWSFGTLYPYEEKEERLPLFDVTKVKVIDLGTMDDIKEIFYNLCQSKTSISKTDREDIATIFKYADVEFPDEIPFKENVALIGKLYMLNCPEPKASDIKKYFKTVTDVLRLITALSEGDTSLATKCKYKSLSRKERRVIMDLLVGCSCMEEDMVKNREQWVIIGGLLHPGEYKNKKYDKVKRTFQKLRNHEHIDTFAGEVETALAEKDYVKALDKLKDRPGEFARKFDLLLRYSKDKNAVINAFNAVASTVAVPVLLQVREYFIGKNDEKKCRIVFPKGQVSRSYCIKPVNGEVKKKYVNMAVKICENALVCHFMKKDFLGNVYASEEFKNFVVPFNQRTASKAFRAPTSGSRMKLEGDTGIIRAFIWWTNQTPKEGEEDYGSWDDECRVDIDLSAAIFNENCEYVSHVSYTSLKDKEAESCHSGDITNGGPVNGDGVSEFLDVNISAVIKKGGRYVVFQVYSYTEQKYSEMEHAMFGWMCREKLNSGEIYEPKTVAQKMDLTAPSVTSIPVIIDCITREIIWCDMVASLNVCTYAGGNNVESNLRGVSALLYNMTHVRKPNLYDLIKMNIRARGLEVEKKKDADVVFDLEEGITPYDLDVFMGEYL